jgi:leader peptidase (prepilin peptidase)/N-methyltransferase
MALAAVLSSAALPPLVVKTILAFWLFALGGVIGSFLNVVIYRLPAGLSLSWPGSHCPACGHPIRWYDNVPVVGWLRLGGRCRDCNAAISPRYPIVEAITAAIFLLVGVVEGLSGGANLPIRPEPVAGGLLLLPPTVLQLAGIVAYHLFALSTLLAAAGIEYDGHPAPPRLWLPALAAGSLAPIAWPGLHPAAAWPGLTGPLAGVADGAAGLGLGIVLGLAARPVVGRRKGFGFVPAAGCVGLFLGWQAVLPVALAAVAIHAVACLPGRLGRGPSVEVPTMWLAGLTLAWILAWKPMIDVLPALG